MNKSNDDTVMQTIVKKQKKADRKRLVGFGLSVAFVIFAIVAWCTDISDRPYWRWFIPCVQFFEEHREGLLAGILAIWAVVVSVIQYILVRMDTTIYGISMGEIIGWTFGQVLLWWIMGIFYLMIPLMLAGIIYNLVILTYIILLFLLGALIYVGILITVYDNDTICGVIYKKSEEKLQQLVRNVLDGQLQQTEIEKIPVVDMVTGIDYSKMEQAEKVVFILNELESSVMGKNIIRNSKTFQIILLRACLKANEIGKGMWLLENYYNESLKRTQSLAERERRAVIVLVTGIELMLHRGIREETNWNRLFRRVRKNNPQIRIIIVEYLLYLLDAEKDCELLQILINKHIRGCAFIRIDNGLEGRMYEYWVEWHRTDEMIDLRLEIVERFIRHLKERAKNNTYT